jgi:hypothetical protein
VQNETCKSVKIVFFGETGKGKMLRRIVYVKNTVCKPGTVFLLN